jgi:D-3-phosphoglycerate dehydrogenase
MKISGLKILAISDLCLDESIYNKAFQKFTDNGAILKIIEWKLTDLQDLRAKVIKTEVEGPNSVNNIPGLELIVSDFDILVTHICPIPEKIIDCGKNLKVIGCARSGFENIDINAATKRKIPVLYCPLSKITAIADFIIGILLSECRSLARSHCKMTKGIWDPDFAFFSDFKSLSNSTVGIIGFGNIAQSVSKRLKGFNVKLLVSDPFLTEEKIIKYGGQKVSLNELLTNSDFVILLARLNEGTKNLISINEFSLMRESAYFINAARAGLVDYRALREVLINKRIAGAALDVFETEPLDKNDPLIKLENVTLTPHIGGVSREGYLQAAKDIAKDIERLLKYKSPNYVANPGTLKILK